MKRLLVFDRRPDHRDELVNILDVHRQAVLIEQAVSIGDVIRKLDFGKKVSKEKDGDNLLIVGMNATDMEILDFIGYINRNKPAIQIVLYSSGGENWLEALANLRGKRQAYMAIKSEIGEVVSGLLNGVVSI